LREAVMTLAIPHDYKQAELPILTLSLGAARIQDNEAAADSIRRADRQLYEAKRAGRNCVFVEPQ